MLRQLLPPLLLLNFAITAILPVEQAVADIKPISHPIVKPTIPKIPVTLPKQLRIDPTEIKIFDRLHLQRIPQDCFATSGTGASAMLRGAPVVYGFQHWTDAKCYEWYSHVMRTLVYFGNIQPSGQIFPTERTIVKATLFYRLRENGTQYSAHSGVDPGQPEKFELEHTKDGKAMDVCSGQLVIPTSDVRSLPEDTLPPGTKRGLLPNVGAQNGVFRMDITDLYKDWYFRKTPHYGIIFAGSFEKDVTDRDTQCTSMIDNVYISVDYQD